MLVLITHISEIMFLWMRMLLARCEFGKYDYSGFNDRVHIICDRAVSGWLKFFQNFELCFDAVKLCCSSESGDEHAKAMAVAVDADFIEQFK